MRKQTKSLFTGALFLLCTGIFSGANAAVLTFDETAALSPWGGGTLADGFSIPSLTTTQGAATSMGSISNTAYSGSNAMYNWNGREGLLVKDTTFDMVGAYFKGDNRYNFPEPQSFVATGYDALDNVLYSTVITTLTNSWTYIAISMSGISKFGFNPLAPDVHNMQMDDFTYNTASVPAPFTMALFGLGLLGLGISRSRRRSGQ